MFYYFNPKPPRISGHGPIWEMLAPLSQAARDDLPLEAPLLAIVRSLGFAGFTYGMSSEKTVHAETRYYHWSTAPRQWIADYDRLSYVEVDPRVEHGWTDPTPLIWDRRIAHDRPATNEFLERAAASGIGSGICVFFRDHRYSRVLVSVDTPNRDIDDAGQKLWASMLVAILMLGFEFHAIFLRRFAARGIAPQQQGLPVSRREQQCLAFAAKGLTSADIAIKLDLSERTVNFHFGNVVSKLAAANRTEAIAIAIARGIISN